MIALLLADPLAPDAGPGVATSAIGAAFVAAQLAGADTERLVLADCPIDLPLTGPITVWSGAGPGETCPPEEFGDLIGRLIALADARGGLAAGELAAFGTLTPGTGLLVGCGHRRVVGSRRLRVVRHPPAHRVSLGVAAMNDTTTTDVDVDELARQLDAAWEGGDTIAPLSETLALRSTELAYQIQTRWSELRRELTTTGSSAARSA